MEPQDMTVAMEASLAERTGRTLTGWVDLVNAEGPDPLDQRAVRAWLRVRAARGAASPA